MFNYKKKRIMKCTNFREELDLIHQKELNELIVALEAHGGEYEFGESIEDRPQVVMNVYYNWKSVRVGKVGLDSGGKPYVCGEVIEEYAGYYLEEVQELDASEIMTGDVLYIISKMDEPEQ